MSAKAAFVMMIQEKWWNGFLDRSRQGKEIHAYVQRGAAPPNDTSLIFFYVTKPVGEISGYADFIERKTGKAATLWKELGSESVLTSEKKYEEFIKDAQKVSFIRFKNLKVAERPIPLKDLLKVLRVKRLSRKGFYIGKETERELLTRIE
jgi:predicted transcriptional regulator